MNNMTLQLRLGKQSVMLSVFSAAPGPHSRVMSLLLPSALDRVHFQENTKRYQDTSRHFCNGHG